jgi:hypothetical protein
LVLKVRAWSKSRLTLVVGAGSIVGDVGVPVLSVLCSDDASTNRPPLVLVVPGLSGLNFASRLSLFCDAAYALPTEKGVELG